MCTRRNNNNNRSYFAEHENTPKARRPIRRFQTTVQTSTWPHPYRSSRARKKSKCRLTVFRPRESMALRTVLSAPSRRGRPESPSRMLRRLRTATGDSVRTPPPRSSTEQRQDSSDRSGPRFRGRVGRMGHGTRFIGRYAFRWRGAV